MTEITKEEQQVYWVAHDHHPPGLQPGSFREKLIEALLRADDKNYAKLESVFPEIAAAIKAWRFGDLSQRMLALGGRP